MSFPAGSILQAVCLPFTMTLAIQQFPLSGLYVGIAEIFEHRAPSKPLMRKAIMLCSIYVDLRI